MSRQEKAQQTKNRISKIALALFNEKGFTNVTVDEIIEKADSSKGAFYNHFKSKHEIFAEKFKEIDNFYVEELFPQLKAEKVITLKLKQFLFMQMTYIEQDLGWDVVRTIYEQELNPERESYFSNPARPLYQFLIELLNEGIENNEIRDDLTAHQMHTVLIHAMRGILYDWGMNRGAFSLVERQALLFDVVIRGLEK
ncbi:hypothetical protein Plano_2316 [Planococcus sp. PAMC 21323]|uniref:TetR/AcrR family transcriptional regulator n=1 Tax=Planococcus sp. PAMC 21323 TaxID=1526927 RepID=UPI000585ED52|nr:TetR/AcrR family transcriptional regulator [Planococcus sp. PAMC 21323]AIY06281.1 hypothetical protein Plano_2316 [Planococcus sp. PAMC 21323]